MELYSPCLTQTSLVWGSQYIPTCVADPEQEELVPEKLALFVY